MGSFDFLPERLIDVEIALSKMYHHFSASFPESADFWNQMASEEEEHSRWVGESLEMLKKGPIRAGKTAPTGQAVDTVIKHVDSICAKCARGEISILNAYAHAYDLENSLLEKKFFSLVGSQLPPYGEVGSKLFQATQAHRQRIGEALKRIKSGKKGPAFPA